MTEHDKNYKLCNDSKMKRKTSMHNNLIVYVGLSFIALMACYCVYGQLFDKSESSELFFSDVDHVKIGDVNKKMTLGRSEIENMDKMGALHFGKAKYIIHIHKLSYRLDLYEKGKKDAIKRYGIPVTNKNVEITELLLPGAPMLLFRKNMKVLNPMFSRALCLLRLRKFVKLVAGLTISTMEKVSYKELTGLGLFL